MKRTRFAVALAALTALTIGSSVQASEIHRPTRVVYVALGDSLTQGVGAANPQRQSYPALLARHLSRGSRFLNLAFGPETKISDALTAQLPNALKAHATIVTIFLNRVDAHYLTPVAVYQASLTRLLSALSNGHRHVFIANTADPRVQLDPSIYNPDPKAEFAQQYNAAISAAAVRYGARVVDLFSVTQSLWGRRQNINPSDADHLTATGYAVLARIFYRVMHQSGAL